MRSKSAKGEQMELKEEPGPEQDALRHSETANTTRDWLSKHRRQEFFLPVSGFVWLYPEEVQVFDHPAVQRLARVYQLGQTYMVYRGATHKRLEHVLGTVQVVQRMMDAIEHNRRKAEDESGSAVPEPLTPPEQRFVRLGALLHDIGHLPAGHTVEDELELTGKHDEDQRLNLAFQSPEWKDLNGSTLAELVDRLYDELLPKALKDEGVKPHELVQLLVRKENGPDNPTSQRLEKVRATVRDAGLIRISICRDLIGNTICADLLDYIYRDWYHVGKPRPVDGRIFQYMEVQHSSQSDEDVVVISLGKRSKLRTDAISQILDLLEWRYQLAESVLFHRKKLSAASMLDRALFELWRDDTDVDRVLFPLSDEQMLATCHDVAEKKGNDVARQLLLRLQHRQLFSSLLTRFKNDQSNYDFPGTLLRYAGVPAGDARPTRETVREAARNRATTLRCLENDFGLAAGSLAMYCPARVNAKIAEVRIEVEGHIAKFNQYEKDFDNALSGGHLDAQLRRFKDLWRIHFFIDPVERERIGEAMERLLREAISRLVLGENTEEPAADARNIARLLSHEPTSPWHNKEVEDGYLIGAKRNPSTASESYPTGAPSVRSFFAV